jgi:hypothetical protein
VSTNGEVCFCVVGTAHVLADVSRVLLGPTRTRTPESGPEHAM